MSDVTSVQRVSGRKRVLSLGLGAKSIEVFTQGRLWWLGVFFAHALIRLMILPAFWLAWRKPFAWPEGYLGEYPTWWSLVSRGWDGMWYEKIAREGYPRTLPHDSVSGEVVENTWAFFPAYPKIVGSLGQLTGLSWDVLAPLVSFMAGYFALCVVYLLVREAAPKLVEQRKDLPFLAVLGVAAFPGAGVFGAAYPETMTLLAISGFLLCLVRQQYVWALLPLIVAGFTRGIALPLVCALIWHVGHRAVQSNVSGRNFRSMALGDWIATSLLLIAGTSLSFVWPLIAGTVTGVPNAYVQTQAAWRGSEMSAVPFTWWYTSFENKLAVSIFLFLSSILIAIWVFSARSRSLGPEIQAWGGAYMAYLLMLMGPSTSLPRYLALSILLPITLVYGARDAPSKVVVIFALVISQALLVFAGWGYLKVTP